jgi:multisubunit Na+/H+ antiporter MnhF subunit
MNHTFNGMLFGVELLLVPIAVSVWIALSGDTVRRLIGIQLFGTLGAFELGLLSIVFATEQFADLAIAMALLAIGASVAYAHFLERWL